MHQTQDEMDAFANLETGGHPRDFPSWWKEPGRQPWTALPVLKCTTGLGQAAARQEPSLTCLLEEQALGRNATREPISVN